jgi:hypothetical protein
MEDQRSLIAIFALSVLGLAEATCLDVPCWTFDVPCSIFKPHFDIRCSIFDIRSSSYLVLLYKNRRGISNIEHRISKCVSSGNFLTVFEDKNSKTWKIKNH